MEQGKVDEARRRLAAEEKVLAASAAHARAAAPESRRGDVDKDFTGQAASIANAATVLAKPSRAQAPRLLRSNQETANEFRR